VFRGACQTPRSR